MLARNERVSRKRFKTIRGKRVSFRFGALLLFKTTPPRAAVIVSKQVCRGAVPRNRLRRRIYAVLQSLIRDETIHTGVLLYPNKNAITASNKELRESLRLAFCSV